MKIYDFQDTENLWFSRGWFLTAFCFKLIQIENFNKSDFLTIDIKQNR